MHRTQFGESYLRRIGPGACTHKWGIRRGVGEGSALPPKADIRQRSEHVCYVPLADIGLNDENM
jgi:hypothetical protein